MTATKNNIANIAADTGKISPLLLPLTKDSALAGLFDFRRTGYPFAAGLSTGFVSAAVAALFLRDGRTICLITPDEDTAANMMQDIRALLPGYEQNVLLLPPLELSPVSSFRPDPDVVAARIQILSALVADSTASDTNSGTESDTRSPLILIVPAESLLSRLQNRNDFQGGKLTLAPGVQIEMDTLSRRLTDLGYQRETMVDTPGSFACRGGLADIFPIGWSRPVRLDFFDIEIESLRWFDPSTQRSTEICQQPLELFPCRLSNVHDSLFSYLPDDAHLIIDEPALCERSLLDAEKERMLYLNDLVAARRLGAADMQSLAADHFAVSELIDHINALPYVSFSDIPGRSAFYQQTHIDITAREIPSYIGQMQLFANDLALWRQNGWHIFFCASSDIRAAKLRSILSDHDYPEANISVCPLSRGFEYPDGKIAVITEKELLGKESKSHSRKSAATASPNTSTKQNNSNRVNSNQSNIDAFIELKPGDFVVHTTHGIGRFTGIERVTAGGSTADYLKIEYAAGDKLFIPVEQMHLVQKYIGNDAAAPRLNRLGSGQWAKVKAKVKASVQDMADELLKLYAAREKTKGFAFSPDNAWQQEFEDAFAYEETPGQLHALADIKKDMESPRPMDRLLCGDVGYGKTELAMRAAFKAIQDSKQTAMLTPTTLLAEQHYNTFCQRFKDYPIKIVLLDRFVGAKKQKEVLEELATGQADILIGTHRLLSKDVKFANLGLLIVDEEQRFGVAHKESIKKIRGSVDVLTLSATPIPRTLHMSLAGIRDMSVINTPPRDRLPVQTYVTEHHPRLLQKAIERELARHGQIYYIYNNVHDIELKRQMLAELVPNARILIAHGQMTESQIKPVMSQFLSGEADILLCTTIAEAGLDIPNVNTLIVEDADHFGLAQLYQLRGRVGRANRQAFAYFTYQPNKLLKDDARKRLAAIRDFTQLGAGFKIAMRDLEIRGAGNLLGPEQHGHIAAVGFDLYCRLVNEAVAAGLHPEEYQNAADTPPIPEMKLDLGVSAYLPDDYIPDTAIKFEVYNKLAACRTREEMAALYNELVERFGKPPRPAVNLFRMLTLRNAGQKLGLMALLVQDIYNESVLTLNFGGRNPFSGQTMLSLATKYPNRLKFTNNKSFIVRLTLKKHSETERLQEISEFLQELLAKTTQK